MSDSKHADSMAQDPLEAMVRQTLKNSGQLFEGYTWAILPLEAWAERSGLSLSTVKRRFSKPPYDTLRKVVEGKQATLVRIGKPDPNQPSRLAAIMAKEFFKRTGKRVTPREYGCLLGLAKDWRHGWQLKIFRHAITPDGWKGVKALSKWKTQDLDAPLDTIKPKAGKVHLYQVYPHIPTLRLFWFCAEREFVSEAMDKAAPIDKAFWLNWWQDVDDPFFEWEPNFQVTADHYSA